MEWTFAHATTIGRTHRDEIMPTNGQDACYLEYNPQTGHGLAVVSDGCGSSRFSEVGAHLGVRLLAEIWREDSRKVWGYRKPVGFPFPHQKSFRDHLVTPLVERLRVIMTSMGHGAAEDRLLDAVKNYGMFTLNGVMFDAEAMVFFCIGDGVTVINDDIYTIEPPERDDPNLSNAPDYLGYTVVDPMVPVKFRFYKVLPTAAVQSFVVGSDGLGDLICAPYTLLPGMRRVVGPFEQLWQEDKYFIDPSRLQKLLNLAGRNSKKLKVGPDGAEAELEISPGLLSDDTTLIVGRQVTGSIEPEGA